MNIDDSSDSEGWVMWLEIIGILLVVAGIVAGFVGGCGPHSSQESQVGGTE